jgi:hypothetical protein
MGDVLTAYSLGLNATMARYCFRYHARYAHLPFNCTPEPAWVQDCLDWIAQDLLALARIHPDSALLRALQERLQLASRRFRPETCDDHRNWPEAKSLCRVLMKETDQLIGALPLLRDWFLLGQAVGWCYCDLLRESTSTSLPHLPQLFRVISGLPAASLRASKLLRQLSSSGDHKAQLMSLLPAISPVWKASAAPSSSSRPLPRPARNRPRPVEPPLPPFAVVLQWLDGLRKPQNSRLSAGVLKKLATAGLDPGDIKRRAKAALDGLHQRSIRRDAYVRALSSSQGSTISPSELWQNTSGLGHMHAVRMLDLRLRDALREVPHGDVQIVLGRGQPYGIHDGKPHPISDLQAGILELLQRAGGEVMTGDQLLGKLGRRRQRAVVSKAMAKLKTAHPALRNFVRAAGSSRGGYWWAAPA